MSEPTPEQVEGYFNDPQFPRLPPGCGAESPNVPGQYCSKPSPCYTRHQAGWWDNDKGEMVYDHWPNPVDPPKRTPNHSGAKGIADRVARGGSAESGSVMSREETLDQGRTLRDAGIAQILGNDDVAAEEWKALFRDRFRLLLATRNPFYADDIIESIGLPPDKEDGTPRSNLVGAMFNAEVRRAGDGIQEVDRVQMTRASAHARKTSLWQGV